MISAREINAWRSYTLWLSDLMVEHDCLFCQASRPFSRALFL